MRLGIFLIEKATHFIDWLATVVNLSLIFCFVFFFIMKNHSSFLVKKIWECTDFFPLALLAQIVFVRGIGWCVFGARIQEHLPPPHCRNKPLHPFR